MTPHSALTRTGLAGVLYYLYACIGVPYSPNVCKRWWVLWRALSANTFATKLRTQTWRQLATTCHGIDRSASGELSQSILMWPPSASKTALMRACMFSSARLIKALYVVMATLRRRTFRACGAQQNNHRKALPRLLPHPLGVVLESGLVLSWVGFGASLPSPVL